MRWDNLKLDGNQPEPAAPAVTGPARPSLPSQPSRPSPPTQPSQPSQPSLPSLPATIALFERDRGLMGGRTFDTPGFRGITFYEIQARTVINKVPASSRMSFKWTINPYRGCSHACTYCFARSTHNYLDLDAGLDFNSKIIVKVNAPERARKELAAPRWAGEHVAMGTNVDCYQRAEGRYRLMPGIIAALRDAANPFSILTKGTLILRDLDLLCAAAEVTDVGLNVSVGSVDKELWRRVEPGTPSPQRQARGVRHPQRTGPELRCPDGSGDPVPFRLTCPARRDGAADRGGGRGTGGADRAAPAPGGAGMVWCVAA